jgi:hypothetical protein
MGVQSRTCLVVVQVAQKRTGEVERDGAGKGAKDREEVEVEA